MSGGRIHTEVDELGWEDLAVLLKNDPVIRAEGRCRYTRERFNLAVRVDMSTWTGTTVEAETLARGERVTLRWESWDWVSWDPARSAAGRRRKLTHEGQVVHGDVRLWPDGRLVHKTTNEVLAPKAIGRGAR